MFVLLIDASLHSRSPSQGQQLAAGTWIDKILPIVATSTAEGQQVAALWTGGLGMTAPELTAELDQVAKGTTNVYNSVVRLRPPVTLAGPAGLLEACLLARSQAAAALRSAFSQALGAATQAAPAGSSPTSASPPPASATATSPVVTVLTVPSPATSVPSTVDAPATAIQTAGTDLQVGDQAYQLFARSLPAKLGVTMPPSVWLANPLPYQSQAAQVFLASLQNTINTAPVHELKIYSVSTSPPPVSTQGAVQVLPDSSAMTVTIVVADVGNQPEKNLTVTAAISPSAKGAASVRDFVDLLPGQARSIVGLGPLNPPQGPPFTLTITVTPPAGSTTPVVSQALTLSMPAPPPPSTTSTVPATTSTTKH